MKVKLVAIICLVALLLLLGAGCTSSSRGDFDDQLGSIVGPYQFSIAGWEFKTISGDLIAPNEVNNVEDESGTVIEYFSLVQRISSLNSEIANSNDEQASAVASFKAELDNLQEQKAALESSVMSIIQRQITEVLAEQGIYNPIGDYIKLSFPPVYFKLEEPPNLLVISPRDKIERLTDVLLQTSITHQKEEDIESKVDKLGVSSLVVPLGGIATYPSFVVEDCGLQFAIETITHEWVHQYLTFKPLGFLYLLDNTGIYRNYEVATIDETLAGIVSKEISAAVYEKYYPTLVNNDGQATNPQNNFFNSTMRAIRKTVDEYLAQGEIDKAEQYMEAQRQYLASKGYYVRKLNQAYFAFYGTYADSPTSINPIGTELKELRSKSASLKDFLETASAITSRQALQAALGNTQ